jgi:hypothetical protein
MLTVSATEHLTYFFTELLAGAKSGPESAGFDIETFVKEYAAHSVALASLRFSSCGSLTYARRRDRLELSVGPLVGIGGFNKLEPPYWFGPFRSSRERYLTQIDNVLGNIGHSGYYSDQPVTACLIHLFAASLVSQDSEMAIEETEFFIKHADLHQGQFLMKDGHISGILDWEW